MPLLAKGICDIDSLQSQKIRKLFRIISLILTCQDSQIFDILFVFFWTVNYQYRIGSNITVRLKCWIFLHRVPPCHFFKGGQTLTISSHKMAPMGAFRFYKNGQKLLKWPQMTFWPSKWSPLNCWGRLNKQSLSFLKFIIFVNLERKPNFTVILLRIGYV